MPDGLSALDELKQELAQENQTEDRRFFPKSEKDEMPESDFGDPSTKSFPIKSPQDVINAAMNLGRTKGDQTKIKARIKAIAKRKGYPLPKSWSDEEGSSSKEEEGSDKEEKERALDTELSFEQALEALYRRYYSQAERESMDESDFAGPHRSFPIKTQQDVHNAASLIGHADDPGAVKSRIKSIAKRKGFALPKSWEDNEQEESDKKDRAMSDQEDANQEEDNNEKMPPKKKKKQPPAQENAEEDEDDEDEKDADQEPNERSVATEQHENYTGSHSHNHTHGDTTHSHAHDHSADHDHKHSHPNEKVERAGAINTSDRPAMYMPFTRVDAAKREVIGQATAEVPDSYGTIFAFYPPAWEKWRGNIREQHDPKKAVGKRIQHFLHEDSKSVDLHARVSRGAQDTWMKVEDDVLTGFSLSVIPDAEFGNNVSNWPKKEYQGKLYPYLPRYSIAEISLVDNPSCPNCNIQIVRADGFATDILEFVDEDQPFERVSAKVSSDTMNKMHKGIKSTLHSAMTQMENCNCPQCQKAITALDPDRDGDIDLGGLDDRDHDAKKLGVETERMITGLIDRSLQPVYSRLQKIAGTLSRTTPEQPNLDSIITGALLRAFDAFEAKLSALPSQSSIDELRAELSAVKGQVDKIADQPMPGGPIMNAGVMPPPVQQAKPVEKRIATDPPLSYGQTGYGSVYDAIATLSRHGQLNTTDKQVDAMAEGLIAQRRR